MLSVDPSLRALAGVSWSSTNILRYPSFVPWILSQSNLAACPRVPYKCSSLCVRYLIAFPDCCSHRTHGDLVSGLYQQILLSLQKVLTDPVRPLCSHYGAVVGLHALGWKVRTWLFSHILDSCHVWKEIAFMYIFIKWCA